MNREEVIKDPDFLGLPDVEKQKVLQSIDPEYSSLSDSEQLKVVTILNQATTDIQEKQTETPEWAGKYPNLYGLLGATKEVARFAGETAGMVGGGILGAPLGPAGAVAGGALGYGSVKALERQLEGEKATIPQAAMTAAKDVSIGAAMEIGGQTAGKVIGGALERISRPTAGGLIPREIVQQRIADAKKLGITISPAEATGSKALALYESMLDKSPFSTTIINDWRELNQLKPLLQAREKALQMGKEQVAESLGVKIQEQVNGFVSRLKVVDEAKRGLLKDKVIAKLGSTESFQSLGESAQSVLARKSAEAVAKKNQVYSEIGSLIPTENVTTPELANVAQRNIDELAKLPNQDAELVRILKWAAQKQDDTAGIMESIKQYPPEIQKQIIAEQGLDESMLVPKDWATLQRFRVQLNDMIKQSDLSTKSGNPALKGQMTNEGRIYSQLKAALDKDFETIAAKTGPDVLNKMKAANAFFQDEYAPIWKQAGVIRKVAYSNPSAVVDVVLQPKNVVEIDALRKAMGEQGFSETIKPMITNRLLGKSETFNPQELSSALAKYGDETLGKIYAPQELTFLKTIAKGDGFDLSTVIPIGMKPIINEISKRTPSTVVDAILGSFERSPNAPRLIENLTKVRTMVDKEAFEGIKAEFADRLFKTSPITQYVQPGTLSKNISKLDRVLKILYTPEQVAWLKQVSETGRHMAFAEKSAANPSGTAMNVVTWGTFGAILNSPVSGIATGVIAPKFMANIYLSKAGRRYFTEGMRTPLGTKRGVEIATKLVEIAGVDLANQAEQ